MAVIEAIRRLLLIAEEGGFECGVVWPAHGPRSLVFHLIGDTTPRGLAAAVELREMFDANAEAADALFNELFSVGAHVLHDVREPQKLFPVTDEPTSDDPPEIGADVIFLHDGPEGWAVLAKVEHIEADGLLRFDVPAGSYAFSGAGGRQKALRRPDTAEAETLETWLLPANNTNRAIYLARKHVAELPARQVEKLIRHSPSNARGLQ